MSVGGIFFVEDGRKLLDTDGKRLGPGTEQIRTEKDRAQELRYIYSLSAPAALALSL